MQACQGSWPHFCHSRQLWPPTLCRGFCLALKTLLLWYTQIYSPTAFRSALCYNLQSVFEWPSTSEYRTSRESCSWLQSAGWFGSIRESQSSWKRCYHSYLSCFDCPVHDLAVNLPREKVCGLSLAGTLLSWSLAYPRADFPSHLILISHENFAACGRHECRASDLCLSSVCLSVTFLLAHRDRFFALWTNADEPSPSKSPSGLLHWTCLISLKTWHLARDTSLETPCQNWILFLRMCFACPWFGTTELHLVIISQSTLESVLHWLLPSPHWRWLSDSSIWESAAAVASMPSTDSISGLTKSLDPTNALPRAVHCQHLIGWRSLWHYQCFSASTLSMSWSLLIPETWPLLHWSLTSVADRRSQHCFLFAKPEWMSRHLPCPFHWSGSMEKSHWCKWFAWQASLSLSDALLMGLSRLHRPQGQ